MIKLLTEIALKRSDTSFWKQCISLIPIIIPIDENIKISGQ